VDAAAPVQVLADRASAADLGAAYTKETKKQWTQPLGFTHALFEVAVDVLKRAASLDDKSAVVAAIKATNSIRSWPDQLGQGARAQCHQDPAGRRAVGARQGLPLRHGRRQQKAASSVRSPGSSGPSARRERRRPLMARCSRSSRLEGVRIAPVIDELTLEVGERERWGHRPNGAADTALNLMIGRLRPSAGGGSSPGATSRAPRRTRGAGRHRAHSSDPAFVRRAHRFENVLVGGVFGGRPPSAWPTVRPWKPWSWPGSRQGQYARGALTLLERKRPGAGAGPGHRAARAACSTRSRAASSEPECTSLVEVIRSVHGRGRHHLDRAHRARAPLRGEPARGHQRRAVLMDGAADEVMASAEVQRVYLGIDVQ